MVLLDLRRLLLSILPIIAWTTHLLATGSGILLPIEKEQSLILNGPSELYITGSPDKPSTN